MNLNAFFIIGFLSDNKEKFSDEFIEWFPDNEHVWNAFVSEALKVKRKGFKHYSARTIVHVLRHHSAVAENGSGWKINDHHSPYLARLFDLVYPQHVGLFEYRVTNKTRKDQDEQARIPDAA
jgi:hypothetical protein